ncbi:Holliday junction branch migration protein RuvA [Synechococcus sp. RSCCF101]|uniref:Holliday junction branch migration protein RuvA n=1 Tax=Synechococcus sp. RSCCF101 TaxID=2511069 RepID=UPI001248C025|nr:Holliday junction branch migration protein RuvA [Synechococcus sp. RSCCF101]QEY33344.1 Holliday junction branch migration protein RuvA [Synechococcus sp. RSCCF101]
MIGWLRGTVLERWQEGTRLGLLLECGGVGYELQVCRRVWGALPAPGQDLSMHVHTLARDEGWQLIGFARRAERDLFRDLIAVSGIGPQAAMALQGELEMEALTEAIVVGDIKALTRAPGVGKRTAERLCVELRERLSRRFALEAPGDSGPVPLPTAASVHLEVRETLEALGYDSLEIQRALHAVAGLPGLQNESDGDVWVREALRALSRAAA